MATTTLNPNPNEPVLQFSMTIAEAVAVLALLDGTTAFNAARDVEDMAEYENDEGLELADVLNEVSRRNPIWIGIVDVRSRLRSALEELEVVAGPSSPEYFTVTSYCEACSRREPLIVYGGYDVFAFTPEEEENPVRFATRQEAEAWVGRRMMQHPRGGEPERRDFRVEHHPAIVGEPVFTVRAGVNVTEG